MFTFRWGVASEVEVTGMTVVVAGPGEATACGALVGVAVAGCPALVFVLTFALVLFVG